MLISHTLATHQLSLHLPLASSWSRIDTLVSAATSFLLWFVVVLFWSNFFLSVIIMSNCGFYKESILSLESVSCHLRRWSDLAISFTLCNLHHSQVATREGTLRDDVSMGEYHKFGDLSDWGIHFQALQKDCFVEWNHSENDRVPYKEVFIHIFEHINKVLIRIWHKKSGNQLTWNIECYTSLITNPNPPKTKSNSPPKTVT